jgi:hypothetical protein
VYKEMELIGDERFVSGRGECVSDETIECH